MGYRADIGKPLSMMYEKVAKKICKWIKDGKHKDVWLCIAPDCSYRLYRDYEPILIGCFIYHYDIEHLPTKHELEELAWFAPRRLKWVYNDRWGRKEYERELKKKGEYSWICEGGINPHTGHILKGEE